MRQIAGAETAQTSGERVEEVREQILEELLPRTAGVGLRTFCVRSTKSATPILPFLDR